MNIYEIKLKLHHDTCWSVLSESYQGLNVRIDNVLYYPFEDKLKATATFYANSEKALKEFINDFEKSYPSKRRVKYIIKLNKRNVPFYTPYYVYFESEYDLSISSVIYEAEIPYWREIITGGNERWKILLFSRQQLNYILERLKQIATIKDLSVNVIEPPKLTSASSPLETLPHKEREIILKAYEMGYYDWPRRISLDELSKIFNISKAALLKNLRKGEEKLLKKILADDN
ncbi:MAG: helix-turn-helix domain-containing protein [Nitrososphaeria archaeon]